MKNSRLFSGILALIYLLQCLPAAALDLEKSFSGSSSGQAEYFNSNRDRRMMIQVNILSGVARPGIHQVPDTTNLLDALALAGGLTPDADFESVYVRRKVPGEKIRFSTIEYDLQDMVKDDRVAAPLLQNNDTILIDAKSKGDQRLLTILAIVASTVGIVSGVLIIDKAFKD